MTATTFEWISWAWIAIGIITFLYLFKTTAPYGRHSNERWGPMVDNRWGWFIMEVFVLVILAYFLWAGEKTLNTVSGIMVGLFVFHYVNRSIVFPLRLKTKGKKMPLIIMVSAMLFNTMNGFFMGYYFGNLGEYSMEWLSDPRFILGMAVFITGMAINWHSDTILINLRKPGETGYKIPKGGMFRWVSCPNLLGEVIEWVGFGILTWSLPGLVFAIWTFANVVPRAISHHRWYKEKFPEYPKDRKAVIPGIW